MSPDGNIAKNYKTRKVRKAKGLAGGTMTVVHEDDVLRMYDDFYRSVASCDIYNIKSCDDTDQSSQISPRVRHRFC